MERTDAMPGGTTAAQGPRELGYDAWMAAAAEEARRTTALLDDLPDPLWDRPTDCAGWAVRDVVAHLAGAAAGNASLRESGRQARLARRSDVLGDFVDRVNDVQVSERRDRSPGQLRAELRDVSDRGVATRRRVPGWLRAVPVPFGPPLGTRPLGYLLGRIYTRDAWMAAAAEEAQRMTALLDDLPDPLWDRPTDC
ncbi:MAG TPA: maleylpyruvate isomerase N-terminal domain-containing protein, partial [Phycicoccus sp.]